MALADKTPQRPHGRIEVFLDVMPGETRGVVVRNDRFEHLIIQRESDVPAQRLGARCVGRIDRIDLGLNGAFVDLGAGGGVPLAFLPLRRDQTLRQGQKIEVVVTNEARDNKGPALKLLGEAEGESRVLTPGPDVAAILADLAPGVEIQTGLEALEASLEAEEEALSSTVFDSSVGLDVSVQRTRALIAVDFDHAGGKDGARGRHAANLRGLSHAARAIRLKSWGGLAAIDLIGASVNGEAMMSAAKSAFSGDASVVFGPINRFGVLMLSLPWRRAPIETVMNGAGQNAAGQNVGGRGRSDETRALDIVRQLHRHMLSDTATPRFVARCAPAEAAIAAPLASRLGPRASVLADPAVAPGRFTIKES